jgi:general secretion pathway protein L
MLNNPLMQSAYAILREFVLWWAGQMRFFVPKRLLAHEQRRDALIIVASADAMLLSVQRKGQATALGRFALDAPALGDAVSSLQARPRDVILRIGPANLLETTIELPLAAERDAVNAIGYEMDRLTPFSAADVVWSAVLDRRDRVRERVLYRLSLVPKATLQTFLTVLERIGLTATLLEAETPDGEVRRLRLNKSVRQDARGQWMTIAWSAVGAMALVTLVLPFVAQSMELGSVEQRIAALAPRIAKVDALRKTVIDGEARSDALAAERALTGNTLAVLAAVTDIMPDDTVLTEFSLHQGRLSISGQSLAAARLIPALAAEPGFRNPAFIAPVTRAPDGHSDLFAIHAEVGH